MPTGDRDYVLGLDEPLKQAKRDAEKAEVPEDAINPAHYRGFTNNAEVIEIAENLTYNRGAAVKYLARAGKKTIADEVEDLEKALWYCQRELERVRKMRDAST